VIGAGIIGAAGIICGSMVADARIAGAGAPTFDDFVARPPIHALAGTSAKPQGLTPAQIKAAYHMPKSSGSGTIALIEAFGDPSAEKDLAAFDAQFALAACTIKSGCLEIHQMSTSAGSSDKIDAGWALETALDAEWAHAVAPGAKILIVEAASTGGAGMMKAVDYARSRSDVVAISMSWGGGEFAGETALDSHFAASGKAFFASSGDDGAGASWPGSAPGVIAVGGTSLAMDGTKLVSEKAWSGSGGGTSAYEAEPAYQSGYSIPRAGGKRAIPDVSYAADPAHGFSVYHAGSWRVVGGTSAGAPQWAAIAALEHSLKGALSPLELYIDKAGTKYADFFRDITSGTNGSCGYYCAARARYDYVTGLGSPVADKF
jgi:subtilase family serine protease